MINYRCDALCFNHYYPLFLTQLVKPLAIWGFKRTVSMISSSSASLQDLIFFCGWLTSLHVGGVFLISDLLIAEGSVSLSPIPQTSCFLYSLQQLYLHGSSNLCACLLWTDLLKSWNCHSFFRKFDVSLQRMAFFSLCYAVALRAHPLELSLSCAYAQLCYKAVVEQYRRKWRGCRPGDLETGVQPELCANSVGDLGRSLLLSWAGLFDLLQQAASQFSGLSSCPISKTSWDDFFSCLLHFISLSLSFF